MSDSNNLKLHLWANGGGREAYLYSETLEQGVNCDVGSSTITISYVDTRTGATTDMYYQLEILTQSMYLKYDALGLLEDTAARNDVEDLY